MKNTLSLLLMVAVAFGCHAQYLSPRTAIHRHQASKYATNCDSAQAQAISDVSMVQAYVYISPDNLDRNALDDIGVKISRDMGRILSLRMPATAIEALTVIDGVEYVQLAAAARQMLDIARDETAMTRVHRGVGLDHPYTGKDVVIGIVDNGYDYRHAAFRNPDGALRISRVWEQSTQPFGSLTSPQSFGYGVELINAEDILNAAGDVRTNSHGTHVTSIAAGSDTYLEGALSGMAPDAEIVLVSMLTAGANNVSISDAISYIFDYADSVGKPCVVNLSLGNQSGPHDGTSTFDVIADALQGPGRLIIGAAGNDGAAEPHLRTVFDGTSTSPLLTWLDFPSAHSGGEIEIWADAKVSVSLMASRTSTAQEVERVQIYPTPTSEATTVSLGRNISGTFTVASEISPLNGKHHIMISSDVTNVRSGYGVVLEVSATSAATVDIWNDGNIHFTALDTPGFSAPTDESTICEIGGTASRILSVGAYTTRKDFTPLGGSGQSLNEVVGDLGSFSSFGPTADGRLKPQITAPGCFISAAVSANDVSGTLIYSAYHDNGGNDNFYGYMQGTSMATPMVTGIVASWLEAYPQLTPEQLVDIVKSTARSDVYTGDVSLGHRKWGYGKIDAMAGLQACLALAGNDGIAGVATDKALVRLITDPDGSISLLFGADCHNVDISVYNMAGMLTGHHSAAVISAGQTLTLGHFDGLSVIRIATPTSTATLKSTTH